jgi:signal transduction histidine kinase/streptogramin lyase
MIKFNPSCAVLTTVILLNILVSCNNNPDEIPFPEDELGSSQPVAIPLQFSAEKKLTWDTVRRGGINPTIKKLDIDQLPSTPYDTAGFKPLSKSPEEVHFDFNSLPETHFDIDELPSNSLQFKTTVFAPPPVIKAGLPNEQKDKPFSIFDFGVAQGLQAKFITCLLKDKKGLMWIFSKEGLFRYDGDHIMTYIPGPVANIANGMAEDNNGRIWYIDAGGVGMIDAERCTRSYSAKIAAIENNLTKIFKDENGLLWVYNNKAKAVSVIDPETLTFKNVGMKDGLSDSSFFEILQDDNKNIWITTYAGGADIIDLEAGKIKYLKKTGGLSSDTLSAMAKDKTGQIWLAIPGAGVDAVNVKEGIIKRYDQPRQNKYTFYLSFDNKGRLWKGTNSGLEIIDPEKKMSRLINRGAGEGNVILSCTPDNYNRMWIASLAGLNIIDQNGETVYPFGTTAIISLIEDAVGNLWIATQKGVVIVNAKRNAARILDKSNGLSNDFVQSFFKIDDKILVTTNAGLNIIDPVKKTIEIINKNNGLANDTIFAAFKDRTGNLWFTGPNGVDMIDSAKKIIIHTDVAGGLNDNTLPDVKQDKDGLIWLATQKAGVDIVDIKKGTIKYLNNQPGLKDTFYRLLLQDKYERMWIGTAKGIYVADIKQNRLTAISTKEGLPNNSILSLLEYNGNILAGTNNKIALITAPASSDEWKISLLNKSQALLKQGGSFASDAVTKAGQYLWGDNGITVINDIKPADDSVNTYITGMNVMTMPQYFVNNKEAKGIDTIWTADSFYLKGQKPVRAGFAGESKLSWDSVSGPYNMPANLNIPYNQNYMQFQFTQAHLSRQDTTWYTYILEGIDKRWGTPTINTYTENYLNLPPGKYVFKVSSKSTGNKWSTPATFSFTVSPPWYKTWWAYTLFALVCIGILRTYIVYRSRMLRKENKILEEKVNLRTTQLQKSFEDLRATQGQLIYSEKMASLGELTAGIAHEIQNPLNFVNNFSDVNIELLTELKEGPLQKLPEADKKDANEILESLTQNLEKIIHHGKRADSIVKGMLQHSRSSNGIKEPTPINTLAEEYLRLSYHGLRAKDKSFNASLNTDFDESIGSVNIIPQDIGRALLNLVTNAFYAVAEKKKQAIAGYEPTVWVSTKKSDGKIEISVVDNGNGIPQKVIDKIFQPFFTTKPTGEGTGLGLSLSYDIIKAHGGEIKVETKEGEGSKFIISLTA